jgi:3-deoxy-manno-octulosonate cytidylyltransferase (CMP-KDO synthetase)
MTARGHDAGLPARAVAILPARLESTRLPRKMLLDATGAPLIVHSARNAAASGVFARVVVAADAPGIVSAARAHGVEAVLTRADHPSGTDRVNECFGMLRAAGETAEIVVGVQGDEPEVAAADLFALVAAFADPAVELATLAVPITDPAQLASTSVVKVVCAANGDALYFSRAPIPARGHGGAQGAGDLGRRHVGVYAFRPRALERFCTLPRGKLETSESLEQLRWLENGGRMRVVPAARAPQGIDTPEDYAAFVERMRARTPNPRRDDPGSGTVGATRNESAVKSDAAKSSAVKSSAVKAGAVEPDAVEPDAAKPDAAKPATAMRWNGNRGSRAGAG